MNAPESHLRLGAAHRVLTLPGRRYAVSDDLREKVCFTNDDILYIAKGHQSDRMVLGFQARLDQDRLVYERRIVDYLELKSQYDNDEELDAYAPQEDAKLQQEILSYIRHANREDASDIHIVVGKHPDPNNAQNLVDSTLIRFRVYGRLITYHTIPRARGEQLIACMCQTMTDQSEKTYNPQVNQNSRLGPKFAKSAGLYIGRIASGPTEDGLHCIVRLQREDGGTITSFEKLGYLPEQQEHLRIMMHRGYGVFFVSGAVGSGKSRTMANVMKMMVQEANGEICIVSLEDPVEFRIPGAQQKPVNVTAEVSDSNDNAWLAGIDHILRSDINVANIGEARHASIPAVISLALTGRPVWTTIHCSNATQIPGRLHDAGVEQSVLTDPLIIAGLINQSLVPTLCKHCKISFSKIRDTLPSDLIARIEKHCIPQNVYFAGDGCEHCKKGITGRQVCAETIIPNAKFMHAYQQGGALRAREYWIKHMRGITKCQHLTRLVNAGLVDPRQGERAASVSLDEDSLFFGEKDTKARTRKRPKTISAKSRSLRRPSLKERPNKQAPALTPSVTPLRPAPGAFDAAVA
ncbi:General secretion pathway protein E [plant metagenome]|uniref:General secretion pathway protein E n=1 Tax=plant metagenome TaxID=1297885 RepID=A0A484U339_9ZZZZ